jgi:hypothetical protein
MSNVGEDPPPATAAERHLDQIERYIIEAEERVTRQRLLHDRLAAGGHDTAAAEKLLALLLARLGDLWARHTVILAEIAAERDRRRPGGAAADQSGLP